MEVISGISVKKRFNNIFLRNHLKIIFKTQSGVSSKLQKARYLKVCCTCKVSITAHAYKIHINCADIMRIITAQLLSSFRISPLFIFEPTEVRTRTDFVFVHTKGRGNSAVPTIQILSREKPKWVWYRLLTWGISFNWLNKANWDNPKEHIDRCFLKFFCGDNNCTQNFYCETSFSKAIWKRLEDTIQMNLKETSSLNVKCHTVTTISW
jgi:hypothetical protein